MASEEQIIATGHWYPPRSSASQTAELVGKDEFLAARLPGTIAHLSTCAFAGAKISSRVGTVPRRITFADGSLFETADNDAIDAYLKGRGHKRVGLLSSLEEFHPRLIVLVLAVFLLSMAVYRYALPVLVEVAVAVTPDVVPEYMSAGTLKSLDQTTFSPSHLPPEKQQEIETGFNRIVAEAVPGSGRYNLNFRDGGFIGPNAFALPDGTVIITDQLIDMAGSDTEMILGVLAHEIGHVEMKHSLRQLYRAAGVVGLIMFISGDIGSGTEDILTQGAGLLALSYSREAEAAADRRSVEIMAKAGYDPTAIGRFFALLVEKLGDRGGTSMLSSHPGTPERRQEIMDYSTLLKNQQKNQ